MKFRGEKFSLFGEKSLTLAKADFLGRFGWEHRAGGRFSSLGVLGRGLEPLWIAPPDPKSGASANFATRAFLSIKGLGGFDDLLFAFVLQIFQHLLPAKK